MDDRDVPLRFMTFHPVPLVRMGLESSRSGSSAVSLALVTATLLSSIVLVPLLSSYLMVRLLGWVSPVVRGDHLLLPLMVAPKMALMLALSTLPTSSLTLRVRLQQSLLSF